MVTKYAQRKRIKLHGVSYAQRVIDINAIYDEHCHSGLSNREILRQFIWPQYHICEKTFYNIINASADDALATKYNAATAQLDLFSPSL